MHKPLKYLGNNWQQWYGAKVGNTFRDAWFGDRNNVCRFPFYWDLTSVQASVKQRSEAVTYSLRSQLENSSANLINYTCLVDIHQFQQVEHIFLLYSMESELTIAVVWQECTKELRRKVERILNYGMRLILSQPHRTPSGGMRHTLHWMPFKRLRTMFRLILMHRCINQLAPAYLNKFVQRNCTLGYSETREEAFLCFQGISGVGYPSLRD